MSHNENPIVKRAHELFIEGDYIAAKRLYSQLSEVYGAPLFDLNIKLCDKRYGRPIDLSQECISETDEKPISVEEQLVETQRLLEYYFNKFKNLEFESSKGV